MDKTYNFNLWLIEMYNDNILFQATLLINDGFVLWTISYTSNS